MRSSWVHVMDCEAHDDTHDEYTHDECVLRRGKSKRRGRRGGGAWSEAKARDA